MTAREHLDAVARELNADVFMVAVASNGNTYSYAVTASGELPADLPARFMSTALKLEAGRVESTVYRR